jgi:hypothetical protein
MSHTGPESLDDTDLRFAFEQSTTINHFREDTAPFCRLSRQREQRFRIALPAFIAEDERLDRPAIVFCRVKYLRRFMIERHLQGVLEQVHSKREN